MAPTIVTADLHRSGNPRDRYRDRWFPQLITLARKLRARRVIVLGDLTEQKDFHGSALTNRLVDDFAALAAECSVICLTGNHDYRASSPPFFSFLRRIENISWISEVTPWDLPDLGNCLFIPHQRTVEAWRDIRELDSDWDWVFTHATFIGSRNEQGMVMEGVPVELVRGHRVVAGDIHVPQTFGKITHVGAPYTVHFGDRFDPRVLRLEGETMRSIPCEGPRKVLVEVDSLASLREQEVNAGDLVKVRFRVAANDYDKWPDTRQKIAEWAGREDVILASVQPLAAVEKTKRDSQRPVAKRTDDDIIRAYCQRHRVGDKTLQTGLKIVGIAK